MEKYSAKDHELEARQRLRAFWDGIPVDRPALYLTALRDGAVEPTWPGLEPPIAERDLTPAWQAHQARRVLATTEFLAEAMPHYTVGYASAIGLLAALLGGEIAYTQGWAAWIQPVPGIYDRPLPAFAKDHPIVSGLDNVFRAVAEAVGRQAIVAPPTFIDPLTTLGCFRTEDQLALDLIERPEAVLAWTEAATTALLDAYEHFYNLALEHGYGESIPWLTCMAEGKMEAVQCDFSIMLSPAMYAEFCVPALRRQTQYYDRAIYHLDGSANMRFIDQIAALPGLDAVQYNPGPGHASPTEQACLADMRSIRERGLSVFAECATVEEAELITRSLGPTGLMIHLAARFENASTAEEGLKRIESAARSTSPSQAVAHSRQKRFTNPVIAGDYPDPAIIRVEDDYYCVHSTFQYFPGVPVMHSRDLVHWRTIGHVLTRPSQLDLADYGDSCGVWAPDIEFHEGRFYVAYPLFYEDAAGSTTLSIHLVWAEQAQGPYSDPVTLLTTETSDGCYIDPGLFFDDDGRKYLLWAGAWMQDLSDDMTHVVGERRQLWPGTGLPWGGEGPHLLKHNGWYYVTIAEGGTFFGHCQTLARSCHLWGPYEPCPENPILRQADPRASIQKAGHGKFVRTPGGEWWTVFLGGRPLHERYCVLGRETFLSPLEYTADEWFRVAPRRAPQLRYPLPSLHPHSASDPGKDDFNAESLSPVWEWVRTPEPVAHSLTERPGWLRLRAQSTNLAAPGPASALLRRIQHHSFSAETRVGTPTGPDGGEAGLTVYLDKRNHVRLGVTPAGRVRLCVRRSGQETVLAETLVESRALTLGVVADQFQLQFCCGAGPRLQQIGLPIDGLFLSPDWKQEHEDGRCFTGAMVGLFVTGRDGDVRATADFDWIVYQGDDQ